MKRVYLTGAVLFLALAGGTVYVSRDTEWVPQADFDVLGILWLLSNLPKLFAGAMALLFLCLAVFCLVFAWRSRNGYQGTHGEEARLLADPRFHGIAKREGD